MISFFLALLIGLAVAWIGFLLSRSVEQHSLWAKWFSPLTPAEEKSVTLVWNRALIAWISPHLKNRHFKNSEMIAWGFCLSLEMALLFSLFFSFHFLSFLSGGAIGALYPWCWRIFSKRKRKLAMRRQLPFMMDLLAVSAQAGLDMMPAIERMVQVLPSGELLSEFKKMIDDLKLGRTHREALEAFKNRVELLEVNYLVSLLLQAVQLGAPLASVLMATSRQLQERRFREAERLGAQAAVKILFPLVFCILPSVFLLIFSPLALRWMAGGMEGFVW